VLWCQLSGLLWNCGLDLLTQSATPTTRRISSSLEQGIRATFVINALSVQMMLPADRIPQQSNPGPAATFSQERQVDDYLAVGPALKLLGFTSSYFVSVCVN